MYAARLSYPHGPKGQVTVAKNACFLALIHTKQLSLVAFCTTAGIESVTQGRATAIKMDRSECCYGD